MVGCRPAPSSVQGQGAMAGLMAVERMPYRWHSPTAVTTNSHVWHRVAPSNRTFLTSESPRTLLMTQISQQPYVPTPEDCPALHLLLGCCSYLFMLQCCGMDLGASHTLDRRSPRLSCNYWQVHSCSQNHVKNGHTIEEMVAI